MSEGLERAAKDLSNTDDAMVWAAEFARIFQGHMIMPQAQMAEFAQRERYEMSPVVDEGVIAGWFANAMAAALAVQQTRDEVAANEAPVGMVPEAQREAFVQGAEEGRQEGRQTDLDDPTA